VSSRYASPLQTCRVLLADSTLMACELLANALQRHSEFDVVTCADATQILQLVLAHQANVAVISAKLGDDPVAGFAAIVRLRELSPSTRIIALLDSSWRDLIVQSFRAGAHGIFCRTDSHKLLARCIACVHKGQIWANSAQLQMALDALSEPIPAHLVNANGEGLLSNREEEVVGLVACGLSNRQIAQQLHVSEHTVKNYLFHVFEKLGISNRVELVLYSLSSRERAGNGHLTVAAKPCITQ
jgi:DNA-binding NarL/FixJ family response regulator